MQSHKPIGRSVSQLLRVERHATLVTFPQTTLWASAFDWLGIRIHYKNMYGFLVLWRHDSYDANISACPATPACLAVISICIQTYVCIYYCVRQSLNVDASFFGKTKAACRQSIAPSRVGNPRTGAKRIGMSISLSRLAVGLSVQFNCLVGASAHLSTQIADYIVEMCVRMYVDNYVDIGLDIHTYIYVHMDIHYWYAIYAWVSIGEMLKNLLL